MPYPNEHAARLRNPDKYDDFARENNKFGQGIDVIFGIYTKDGKKVSEIQAIRFNSKNFTPKQAKEWLKDHDYKQIMFEEATKEKPEKSKASSSKYIIKNALSRIEKIEESDEEKDRCILKGYLAVFNTPDCDGDIIAPTAFDKCIEKYKSENKNIPLKFQHNRNTIIGKIPPDSLIKDEKGLYTNGAVILKGFDEGNKAYILAKEKVINGFSLGGYAIKSKPIENENNWLNSMYYEEIDFDEFSFVDVQAHPDAQVSIVKSKDNAFDLEKLEKTDKSLVLSVLEKYNHVFNFDKENLSETLTRKDVNGILEKHGIVFNECDTRRVCESKLRKAGYSRTKASLLVSKYRQGNPAEKETLKSFNSEYQKLKTTLELFETEIEWNNLFLRG